MERLTTTFFWMKVTKQLCTYDWEGYPDDRKELCTYDWEGYPDDREECGKICEDFGGACDKCILQECLTRLAEYEDTGLIPEEIRELKE